MENLQHREAFSGAVLLARDGKILFARGYGMANLEHDVPNTVDTKFRLGSVTKQFTMQVQATIARFKDKPLDFPPGDRFQYSDSGYLLLGYIIE